MQEQLCAAEARSTALEVRASHAEEQSQQLQQALQQQEAEAKISKEEAQVAAARTAGQLLRDLQAYMLLARVHLLFTLDLSNHWFSYLHMLHSLRWTTTPTVVS